MSSRCKTGVTCRGILPRSPHTTIYAMHNLNLTVRQHVPPICSRHFQISNVSSNKQNGRLTEQVEADTINLKGTSTVDGPLCSFPCSTHVYQIGPFRTVIPKNDSFAFYDVVIA